MSSDHHQHFIMSAPGEDQASPSVEAWFSARAEAEANRRGLFLGPIVTMSARQADDRAAVAQAKAKTAAWQQTQSGAPERQTETLSSPAEELLTELGRNWLRRQKLRR